jgi:hypothetical protein
MGTGIDEKTEGWKSSGTVPLNKINIAHQDSYHHTKPSSEDAFCLN